MAREYKSVQYILKEYLYKSERNCVIGDRTRLLGGFEEFCWFAIIQTHVKNHWLTLVWKTRKD